MERSDEELIAAYLGGEETALGALVERHLNGIYSFALRLVGSQSEAEDIAQETFVKAWQNLKKFQREKSAFKTWILRIARNTAIDHLRKKKNIPFSEFENNEGGNILAETVPDTQALPDELFAGAEDAQVVMRALEELAPKHKEILLLYYTNELTFAEIGELLHEPANTVKSRHRRALAALKTAVHRIINLRRI